MTLYTWPASSRAAVTPGCTVVVRGFVSHTVTVASVNDVGISFLMEGRLYKAPWAQLDPSTLSADPRQLSMFPGGDK